MRKKGISFQARVVFMVWKASNLKGIGFGIQQFGI